MAKRSKPGAGWRAIARKQQILNARRMKKRVIPDKILRKLAALNLPNDKWVYSVCLDALLRGA